MRKGKILKCNLSMFTLCCLKPHRASIVSNDIGFTLLFIGQQGENNELYKQVSACRC